MCGTLGSLSQLNAAKYRPSLLVPDRKHLRGTGIYHNIKVRAVESHREIRSGRAHSATVLDLGSMLVYFSSIV